MNIKHKKLIVSLVLFVVTAVQLVTPFTAVSNAQGPLGNSSETGGFFCDISKYQILKTLGSYSTSLVSTTLVHHQTLSTIMPFFLAIGMSHAEQMGCLNYIGQTALPQYAGAFQALNCAETDENICASLLNQYNVGGQGYVPQDFAKSKVSGSLLGFIYFGQNTMKYEPVPINTAYFFKDYLAKIPIVGETAYAQSYTDYGHTLINAVLNMWKVFRNIAYAIMSVIMLWVGFAIITRRKISSQTVVSVQYALPKIVIALIFIALSYPIGALITSFSWTLFNSSTEIISSITGATPISDIAGAQMTYQQAVQAANTLGEGGKWTLVILMMNAAVGAGGLIALGSFVLIVGLGYSLFALIKAFWLYIKMVISTATAPLQIAMYAMPGNDDKLELWFKQMLAWGGGLFGMKLVLDLVSAFAIDMLLEAFLPLLSGSGTVGTSIVSGSLFNVLIAPMMMIFGAATAIKVPSTIEEMLMGKKKR